MQTLSLSSPHTLSLRNHHFLSLKSPPPNTSLLRLTQHSSFLGFNPLKVSVNRKEVMRRERRGFGPVCYSALLAPHNLHWISTVSSVVLLLAKGTGVQKSFIVPLLSLQAPASLISWIKGEYGMWTAFFALLVRLFFFIPGELELPLIALLLVIVAPYQVLNLRGTQAGVILSLVIAAYLAFQHFTRAGSLGKAFDQTSVIATLAIICIVAVPCLLFI